MQIRGTKDKLYCYVDETGQDTKGKIFIVSIVITQEDREDVVSLLEKLERDTGKKATKWNKSGKAFKIAYIESVFTNKMFKGKIFYSLYNDKTAYKELTVLTVASAINATKTSENYKASIFIDGLYKNEIPRIGASLRKIGVHTEKVRGVRDESNSIIRLADAIAGFVREYVAKEENTEKLYRVGVKNKVLKEV